jgi:hypothetical protein
MASMASANCASARPPIWATSATGFELFGEGLDGVIGHILLTPASRI